MNGKQTGGGDTNKTRKLGRGLSSLMSVEVPVEVVPRVAPPAPAPASPPDSESAPESAQAQSGAPAPAQDLVAAPAGRVARTASQAAMVEDWSGEAEAFSALRAAEAGLAMAGLRRLSVKAMVPNRFQPRRSFSEPALAGLAASIARSGLMQPVVVRPWRGDDGYIDEVRFELVAGERRWRAAAMAGVAVIPAIVRDLSDRDAAEWAVVENVQREELNAMERAASYRVLFERFGLTHAEIGERVGLDRSSVANFIRLTELEAPVRELLAGGSLSAGHGKALLQLPAGESRVALARRAAENAWNVRRLEEAAGLVKAEPAGVSAAPGTPGTPGAPGAKPSAADAGVRDLERRLSEHLGTKVALKTTAKGSRGRIVIEFYGLDHFDGLMGKMGFRE